MEYLGVLDRKVKVSDEKGLGYLGYEDLDLFRKGIKNLGAPNSV